MSRYPEHLRTFDYTGLYRYFLTFCTFQRAQYFRKDANVDLVLTQFLRASREERMALIAYCFMPDHLHLLAAGRDAHAQLKPFVKLAKQYSGYYFKRQAGTVLWQRYGFERVLRSDEQTYHVVRYVIENPVRAGLVRSPEDYPFWGSSEHTREELLESIRAA